MATQENLDKARTKATPRKPSDRDESPDLIESNQPNRGSEPVDPEGPIVEPRKEADSAQADVRSQEIDPIESNDPQDPSSPVNKIREPAGKTAAVNRFGENDGGA